MKSITQLKQQIYDEALNSGYFKNMQAQLKTYVYDLIEKEYNNGRNKTGFQYEHPLLPKLKKYPLTSLCMDLIQQFLESFKFKHTLNVFRKEINRNVGMNRSHLAQSFRIQIKNPDSQAVLLSLVQQMVSGDVGAVRSDVKVNNYFQQGSTKTSDRSNNFMGETRQTGFQKKNEPSKAPSVPPHQTQEKQPKTNPNNSSSNSNINNSATSNSQPSSALPKTSSNETSSVKIQTSKEQSTSKVEEPSDQSKKDKKKDTKKKPVVEKEKPPEGATDLLGDVMKKFQGAIKVDKEKEKKDLFESKRAFSEEKEKKVVDPSEQGANKIRGISMGKAMPSFMNKFIPQAAQPPKNQSYIDQQLDEFQQSKDSTRKNPLFSSSQSGFDKSGFDHSVDSNAIEEYEYVERAKKLAKKG